MSSIKSRSCEFPLLVQWKRAQSLDYKLVPATLDIEQHSWKDRHGISSFGRTSFI